MPALSGSATLPFLPGNPALCSSHCNVISNTSTGANSMNAVLPPEPEALAESPAANRQAPEALAEPPEKNQPTTKTAAEYSKGNRLAPQAQGLR
jgi:hypothetical protein